MALRTELARHTRGPGTRLADGWPAVLGDAPEVPRAAWGGLLDGFSHLFNDLACRLWVLTEGGDCHVLAEDAPLGQVYMDAKGSECGAVQIALNRPGTVFGDFRLIHRVRAPAAIHLKVGRDRELMDLIVVSAGVVTVLEVSFPERPAPSPRKRAWPKAHLPATGAPDDNEERRTS